jgi:hypothetical protein
VLGAFDVDVGTLCLRTSFPPGVSVKTGSAKEPVLRLAPDITEPTLITPYTRQLVKDLMRSAELSQAIITSGIRMPERQAETLYGNIVKTGVEKQRQLYGEAGRKVVQVYVDQLKQGLPKDDIIDAMTDKIEELQALGVRVSKHCVSKTAYAKLNVIDISHSRMDPAKRLAFEKAVLAAKSKRKVTVFISPSMKGGEPAYHLEIPQP